MVNSIVIVGRCGQDPEVKYFDNNKIRTSFSVAVNRWDSRTKSEVADWFNVEVWDKQAEFAGEWVKKGRMVALDGRLHCNRWKAPDGTLVERFVVRATNVRLVDSKRQESAV